jgi:hypothetical protein
MDSCASRVLDSMDKDGFVRRLNRLQGTKLDWYVKDMHRLKESTLKESLTLLGSAGDFLFNFPQQHLLNSPSCIMDLFHVVHPNVGVHPPSIGIDCLIIQIMEITSDSQVLSQSLTVVFASTGLHEFIHSYKKLNIKCNPYPYSNLVYLVVTNAE